MTRQQRKIIEKHFYNYEKERREAAEYLAERAVAGMGVDYSNERVKSSPGNSVEKKVVDAVDEHLILYKWCLVFEKTLERFKWTLKDDMIRMRYVDGNHEVCICDVIGISRANYYYWVEDVLQVAFMWAQEYNLI